MDTTTLTMSSSTLPTDPAPTRQTTPGQSVPSSLTLGQVYSNPVFTFAFNSGCLVHLRGSADPEANWKLIQEAKPGLVKEIDTMYTETGTYPLYEMVNILHPCTNQEYTLALMKACSLKGDITKELYLKIVPTTESGEGSRG